LALPARCGKQLAASTAPALVLQAVGAGETVRLQLTSGSMRPLLRPGDTILVAALDPCALRRGALIVRQVGDELIVHRFLGWREGCVVTRGDSRPFADQPWPSSQLLGGVVAATRGGEEVGLNRPLAQFAGRVLAIYGLLRHMAGRCLRSGR